MSPVLGPPKNAGQIHGREIVRTAPAAGEGLVWDDTLKVWKPGSVSSAGCFDIDLNGDLEPSETVNVDQYYEADGNDDLMPKEA